MKNIAIPSNAERMLHLEWALTYQSGERIYELSRDDSRAINEFYHRYDALQGRPSPKLNSDSLGVELNEAVRQSYREVQEGRRLQGLRDSLKLAAERCPYCGIGAVTDLDHHLPKTTYPIFSIYVRNLIPTCHQCNGHKKASAEENLDRQFIHAYFEKIPEVRFLYFDFKIVDDSLVSKLEVRKLPSMSDELYNRLRFQVEKLDLNERYRAEINVALNSQYVSMDFAYGESDNTPQLKAFLIKSAEHNSKSFGINDWKTAMFFGLAENADFCAGGFKKILGRLE